MVSLHRGQRISREAILKGLVDIQYERNDLAFERSRIRVRGDCIEVWPSYEQYAFRIELFGDEVDQLAFIHPVSGEVLSTHDHLFVYPAKHFVMPGERIAAAVELIQQELNDRLEYFRREGKLLEAQRLSARTRYDIEMLQHVGHCPGIENYSRPLSGRQPGETPDTLYEFFPRDFLLFVDESHVTVPQIRAMYAGDRNRKATLVEHGFRLPSALDNRPLTFEEWEAKTGSIVYVSATPGEYELGQTGGEIAEQVIRPTGLLDPQVEVLPARGQVAHLLDQIRIRRDRQERVLVTALTKRLAEDLAAYLSEHGVAAKWLHSELDAFERVELLRDLRAGRFDALVGVNLLREGLDLPEVSLVAILDADKEGFLRSETSLIQTIGRSARNVNATVLLYADKMTAAMNAAIEETQRRRRMQQQYNEKHGITPQTIRKNVLASIEHGLTAHRQANEIVQNSQAQELITEEYLAELQTEMLQAAADLDFERAASLRDLIRQMEPRIGQPRTQAPDRSERPAKGRARSPSKRRS
jgi:excinuclease ABC subunit B